MSVHVITAILLGMATAICLLASLGVLVMRDALQRLNFSPAATSLAAACILAAVFIEDGDWGVRLKVVLTVLVVFLMNGALSHMTARAIYIRRRGSWGQGEEKDIPRHVEAERKENSTEESA